MKSILHLFPHSFLPETLITDLVSFFGHVRIYQPWFMDAPQFFKDNALEIMNPPEELKPRDDFRNILSGYHAWAEQDNDRSLKEILKLSGSFSQDDSTAWGIRSLLKGTAQPAPGTKGEDLLLKWHLILHLASQIERRHFEIMDMMDKMKERGSVLAGALDDSGEAQGVFYDMDDIAIAGITDNINTGSLLDAWFGLFGGFIRENDLLTTCNRRIMDYISSHWDDCISQKESMGPYSISFNLPSPLSGRYKEVDIMNIRELMFNIGDNPDRCMNEILLLAKKIEGIFPGESSSHISKFQVRHFTSKHGEKSFETNDLLRNIAGKTIILMSSV